MPAGREAATISAWALGCADAPLWLRATAVGLHGRGILIMGAPGSGKSGLALALMAHGGQLLSDDGLWLALQDAAPVLLRPETAPALIEARGIGLLHAGPVLDSVPLSIAVDLDRAEPDRLPPARAISVGRVDVPLILGASAPFLAAALVQMARQGRAEP
jgi:serine kinase of HPr protein (carbohydrate metabolism regulator)